VKVGIQVKYKSMKNQKDDDVVRAIVEIDHVFIIPNAGFFKEQI